MSWKGKAFYHWLPGDFAQSGEIIEEVSPGLLLVRFDRFNEKTGGFPAPEMVLIRVDDLVAKPSEDGYEHPWDIFEDRKALEDFHAFIDGLDEEEEGKPYLLPVH